MKIKRECLSNEVLNDYIMQLEQKYLQSIENIKNYPIVKNNQERILEEYQNANITSEEEKENNKFHIEKAEGDLAKTEENYQSNIQNLDLYSDRILYWKRVLDSQEDVAL